MHRVDPVWKEESPACIPEHFSGERDHGRCSACTKARPTNIITPSPLALPGLHAAYPDTVRTASARCWIWCRFWREPLRATECIRPCRTCFRERFPSRGRPGSWSNLRRNDKRERSNGIVSQPARCHLLVAECRPVDGTATHGCAATRDRGHHAQPAQHLDPDATCRHLSEPGGDHLVECLPRGGRSRTGQPHRHRRL